MFASPASRRGAHECYGVDTHLLAQGVTLVLAGEHQVDIDGPADVLTTEVVVELRRSKSTIVAALEAAEELAAVQMEPLLAAGGEGGPDFQITAAAVARGRRLSLALPRRDTSRCQHPGMPTDMSPKRSLGC